MKTIIFIAITLLAGAIAGTILGILNLGIVEPYIEQAIALENDKAASEGELINSVESGNYRVWQHEVEIVFAYSRQSIPGSSNKRKALIVAGIMWFVLFLVPALKYPANPPAVGNPETIYYRQSLYVAFLAISGFSALGLAYFYRRLGDKATKNVVVPAAYAAIMVIAYIAMPPNPDQITAPIDLQTSFRIASGFTMSIFWGLLGIILGAFWDKLKPHESAKV